jgi:DNA repair exonuclease SbcCD ATPase subunit
MARAPGPGRDGEVCRKMPKVLTLEEFRDASKDWVKGDAIKWWKNLLDLIADARSARNKDNEIKVLDELAGQAMKNAAMLKKYWDDCQLDEDKRTLKAQIAVLEDIEADATKRKYALSNASKELFDELRKKLEDETEKVTTEVRDFLEDVLRASPSETMDMGLIRKAQQIVATYERHDKRLEGLAAQLRQMEPADIENDDDPGFRHIKAETQAWTAWRKAKKDMEELAGILRVPQELKEAQREFTRDQTALIKSSDVIQEDIRLLITEVKQFTQKMQDTVAREKSAEGQKADAPLMGGFSPFKRIMREYADIVEKYPPIAEMVADLKKSNREDEDSPGAKAVKVATINLLSLQKAMDDAKKALAAVQRVLK